VNQKGFCQQAGQTCKESFRLDLMMEGDGVLSNREEPRVAGALGTNREIPVKCFKGIRPFSSKTMTWLVAQQMCLFTNPHSTGYKQEELEATVCIGS